MQYTSVKSAEFIKRPNRFIAHVKIDNREEIVHVKNTGRCKEILKEGTKVILEQSENKNRKTKYSIIAANKGNMLINIDSQVPNKVVYDGVLEGKIKELSNIGALRREVVYGNSRFDLYFEKDRRKGFIEVKGVTLEERGIALFPDAPTERGSKHIYEMIKAVDEGYLGYLFFLIQMNKISYFTPNTERDPKFAAALKTAKEKGVNILAYDSIISENEIKIGKPIKVCL